MNIFTFHFFSSLCEEKKYTLIYFVCVCTFRSAFVEVKNTTSRNPFLSFYHVETTDYTQVIMVGTKYLYLLSHLVNPRYLVLFWHRCNHSLGTILNSLSHLMLFMFFPSCSVIFIFIPNNLLLYGRAIIYLLSSSPVL